MGTAFLIKKDIFKNLMWYTLPNNTKHFPLTIERVKEIKKLNQQGIAVEELEAVEITSKNKEVEPEFVELVGQISLRSLEKNDRRRRDQQRNYREPQGPNGPRPQGQNPNGPRPQWTKSKMDRVLKDRIKTDHVLRGQIMDHVQIK